MTRRRNGGNPSRSIRASSRTAGIEFLARGTRPPSTSCILPRVGAAAAHHESATESPCRQPAASTAPASPARAHPPAAARRCRRFLHRRGRRRPYRHGCIAGTRYGAPGRSRIFGRQRRSARRSARPTRTRAKQTTAFEFLHAVYPRASAEPHQIGARGYGVASPMSRSATRRSFARALSRDALRHAALVEAPSERYGRAPAPRPSPRRRRCSAPSRSPSMAPRPRSRPPLMVADDGVLSPVRQHARGLTYVRAEAADGGQGADPRHAVWAPIPSSAKP